MKYKIAAMMLQDSLKLSSPVVALSFVSAEQGRALATESLSAPSACSFWRQAETGVFFAAANNHYNCPVGAMVMGFDLPEPVSNELMELVGNMTGLGYLDTDEAGKIPVNAKPSQGILYGPLAEFPVEPSVVVCWLTPSQAMIWNEAAEDAVWQPKKRSAVFGRPACAALPYSMKADHPVLSLGCIGMRTFTEISDDRLLAVIPGAKLQQFAQSISRMNQINGSMKSAYDSRKAAFDASGS
jgi:uncharacterized protein (DUF169 family)